MSDKTPPTPDLPRRLRDAKALALHIVKTVRHPALYDFAELCEDAASALASPPQRPFFHCQVCNLDGVGVDEDGCCRTCGAMAQPVFSRSARSEEWHRTMGGTYTAALASQDAETTNERAALAEAYMAGMRAACGQPDGPPFADNGEPYSKGRFNYQYQEGFALAKSLIDEFARRTDKAQDRAREAEASLAAKDEAIATLRAALKEYGGHSVDCKVDGNSEVEVPCSCGLDDALGQPDADREETP